MDASDVRNFEPITAIKKPHSMNSLYLDPINVEPNVDASTKSYVVPKVMGNVETFENTNKPRFATTLSKSSMIVAERDNVDKDICVLISQVLEKDDSNGMSGDLTDKEENSGEKKDQSIDIVNIDDLDSDDKLIDKKLAPRIAKRLKRIKGKVVESSSKPSKALKICTSVSPTKWWSKVVTPATKKRSLKRKEIPYGSIDFDFDVELDVQDIISATRKQAFWEEDKWIFVYQIRLTLERELVKDAFECKEVMGLIQEVGLIKSVTRFGKCYEMFVKEFFVNISKECDNKMSKEFRKVYVRGREITAKQLKEWPRKWKLSAGCLSVKYAVLHRIEAANWVPTNYTSKIATRLVYTERKSRLEILINVLSEEEAKGNIKGDNASEEDATEEGVNVSDDEETTINDED
ncbi:uncharacterized protein LOC127115250 [Lathyrus oleraceus]|uniref:uncharacterized protein LOC127115250 n=1 Tax=Pisum sativum TaxID=3888 RepID=UPI0021CFD29D|nr:uncharacterized protein LOC127115250 [Pisum sativum]